TAHLNDAQYTITTAATDELGASLIKDLRACKEQFVFAFPGGRTFTREQAPEARSKSGPFSSGIELTTSAHCYDPGTKVLYTALLDEQNGLSANYAPALHAPWVKHDLEFEGNTDQYAMLFYPSLRLPGSPSTYFFAGGVGYLTRPTPPRMTVYSSDGA